MSGSRVLGLMAALVLSACVGPEYAGITIVRTDGDREAEVTTDEILLFHGRVVVVEAALQSFNNEKFDALNQGRLDSADDDILDVRSTVYNFGWALVGAGLGQTELEVVVDGAVVDTIPVTVAEPVEDDEDDEGEEGEDEAP